LPCWLSFDKIATMLYGVWLVVLFGSPGRSGRG
jgi:hypothetical protein